MEKRTRRNTRNRLAMDKAVPPPPALASVTSVTASAGSQVTIVFGSPVQIAANNLPATWVFGTSNRTITALVSATATTYVFTVSGSVATGQVYSMPAFDPAARTPQGGFVGPKTGNLA